MYLESWETLYIEECPRCETTEATSHILKGVSITDPSGSSIVQPGIDLWIWCLPVRDTLLGFWCLPVRVSTYCEVNWKVCTPYGLSVVPAWI